MAGLARHPALQVVYGENVSSRERGCLTDPTRFRALFPGLIVRLPRPSIGAVAVVLLEAAQLRMLRNGLRRGTEHVGLSRNVIAQEPFAH